MQWRKLLTGLAVILVLGGLGYSAWRFVGARSTQVCQACKRPVHDQMKTIAMLDGKRAYYCCPACALSEHQQTGKTVQVIELTDYAGGGPLVPANSYVVRNSDINPCLQHHPSVDENKQPLESHFDRCAPSVLAFADRDAAAAFAGEHGGQVLKFSEFAAQFQQ